MALRIGSGARRYLVKPYSIALAVSIPGTAFLIWGCDFICGSVEIGKPYFCNHS
jgi:hypothetical protein